MTIIYKKSRTPHEYYIVLGLDNDTKPQPISAHYTRNHVNGDYTIISSSQDVGCLDRIGFHKALRVMSKVMHTAALIPFALFPAVVLLCYFPFLLKNK